MTIGNHIPEDDLVLFALQLLPEDRMRQAKVHAESCDVCRTEISKLQGDLASYSMTSDIVAPPPEARERVLRQVAKEPKPVLPPDPVSVAVIDRTDRMDGLDRPDRANRPELIVRTARQDVPDRTDPTDRDRGDRDSAEPVFATRQRRGLQMEAAEEERDKGSHSRPHRTPWVLAWTGWAVAAGCSFVAGLQYHQRQQIQSTVAVQQAQLDDATKQAAHAQDALATLTATNAMQVALHTTATLKPGTPSATALAAYLADKGALVFVATHMDPAPAGKTYELWLLPADGRTPMPAGTFKPDAQGSASVVMPQLPKGVPAKGFGVTLENEGGSDTPTLPIVLAGT
jgi:anti-sigma-K factor RskA